PVIDVILNDWNSKDWKNSADALAAWFNARWKKSGYSLSREAVHEILVRNGKQAVGGLGDYKDGAFRRSVFLD
ncbi:hypothetical protein K402DRAFT_340528, partial [Aulographum hederae CBS 113979]